MMTTQEVCHVDRCPKGCTSETGCTRGMALLEKGSEAEAVHLVLGCYDHEGGRALAAFGSKESADAFVARCVAHDAVKPLMPDFFENDDTAYDAWLVIQKEWEAKHPLGEENYFDSYAVQSLPVTP